jgi:putative ABC transport system permease protein
MANQSRNVIGQQIELPFSESLRISYQSLMIRFGRSVITTAGITLGIAFLIFVVISNEVSLSTSAGSTSEQIMDLGEEKETGISTKDKWLIIMSLIVCVVGITNAMLMSVTERFREIGTMKCLGALDHFVVILFLLESGFQGFAGALIGALIGLVASLLMSFANFGLDTFMDFPLLRIFLWLLGGCFLGMVLAVLGAAFPAWSAAKLPPAEAMRTDM